MGIGNLFWDASWMWVSQMFAAYCCYFFVLMNITEIIDTFLVGMLLELLYDDP